MGEAKAKKKKGLNPLILVIIVLILAIVGMAAYFLFIKKADTPGPYVPQEIDTAEWTTDEFLLNLADTDMDRYVKLTLVFKYDSADKELAATLEKDKAEVRDAVINVLMSKKKADFDGTGKDKLKVEIIKKVNAVLGGNKIVSVLFTGFLIQ